VEKCINNCFRHVCLHISRIDLSFRIKTTVQREFFFFFLLCQSSAYEKWTDVCLSLFFRRHARFYMLITYQSAIIEKKSRAENERHFFKHDTIDRSINIHTRVFKEKDNRTVWWAHFLFLPFAIEKRMEMILFFW
jgi:hypothetical protein